MSLKVFYIRLWLIGVLLLVYGLGFGQTVIFDEDFRSGPLPIGWGASSMTYQTGGGGYIRFDNFDSELITPTFDGSSYTSIDVTFSVANFGTGGNSNVIVEYSINAGSTWTIAGQITTNGSNYETNTISFSTVSSTMEIRFSRNNAGAQKRFRDLTIVGIGGSPTGYCDVVGDTTFETSITEVSFAGTTNTSALNGADDASGYIEFATPTFTVNQSDSYNLSVNLNTDGDFQVHAKAWIDWNQDFIFDESTEEYDLGDAQNVTNGATSISPTITVPLGAVLGNTRMRIISRFEFDPIGPCFDTNDGEIEDYTVEVLTASSNTELQFNLISDNVSENAGTYAVAVNIANPNNSQTQVEVALMSGNAADVDNYTTQSLTFPPNSSASQTLSIDITDNLISNPDKTLVFTLQNPTGGNSASIGTQDAFTLTILDDELAPPIALPYNEDFSNCVTAEWLDFDEDGGDDFWNCSGGEYAMNGFGATEDINWLVSEFQIDFDAYSLETIEVKTQERYGNMTNEPGEFQLLYSTDYDGSGDPTGFNWTALPFDPNNSSNNTTLSPQSTEIVDASGITGIAFLAFKYDMTGVDAEDWRIQEINITDSSGGGNSCSNIFSDNFDGSLGQWSSTNDWAISNNELKHDLDNIAGNSYIYGDITTQDLTTANYEWEVCIRNGDWDPSSSNKFSYFLVSDQSNLSNPSNGYAVGLNMTSSSDLLSLYKIDAGVYTPIVTSLFDWDQNDDVCVKVTRSNTGEWVLLYDNGSGEVNGGTIVDNTYTSGQFIGTYFEFTSTRAGELWLDDISVCRDDNISVSQFIIDFDEDDKWTAGSSPISSYASNHTYQDQNWLFTDGPALRNTTTNQDGFQGALDVYAWRLENAPNVAWTGTYQGNEVIKKFGFDVRRWSSSPEPDYNIEYSIDGGSSFINTGNVIDNALLNNSSDWYTYAFELPSIQHHDSDDFVVQLVRNGGERIMVDNFLYEFALEDTDSEILAPDSQVADGNLIVGEAVDTFDAVSVFAFKLQDSGSGDGLPTIVNSMRFIAGNQNTAIFDEVIDEVVIYVDNTRIFNNSTIVSLSENEINIEFDYSEGNVSSLLEIADNTTKNIEVRVSVNQTGMVSGETFQIAIDDNSMGFGVARDSSIFSRNILPISGNEFEIRVNATQLNFVQQPQYAKVNNAMPFGVSVSASDAAGNIDRSITGQVELTSTGSLQSSPLTANFVNGIATFNNIIHTATGNDLELIATDENATLSPTTSLSFDIRNPLELFISEVTDPLNTPGGRYVEIYNHSIDTIDFNSENVFLVIEFNGGSSYRNIQLTGQLPPKSYYLVGQDEFSTHYGFSAQIEEVINPVASGDGNDTYFLSFGGNDNEERIRNFFDIYGEVGVDALSSTPWFYQEKIVYRKNPNTTEESQIWDSEEWDFISGSGTIESATPSYGNQDYIYENNSIQWNGIGAGDPMIGAGVSNQENIEIREGEVSLFGDIEVHDLIVRSGATLELEPGVILNVSGDIVNEGTIIFQSDDNSTAVLEAVQPNTRVVGDGFEIHRRIPVQDGVRSFRYLSSSVDTQNSAKPTINDNWQEGLFNPDINTNNSGTAGLGTHITGTDLGDNLGFDVTATGNPSMFEFNPATQNWSSVPNTNSKTFGIGDAFAILVRGDRTTTLDSNSAVGPSTTLRTTGQIHVGDFTLDSSELAAQDFFTLVGNPYQSQVDLKALITNSSIYKHVYIYDPTIGDLGNTITLDLSMETVSPTPSSSANQYLQPNQAFFVKTIGPSPEINFTESTKNNTGSQTGVFNEQPDDITQLDISIKNANQELQDGIRIVYGDTYSNTVNYDDATKLFNSGETIAIESSSAYLSIEKRDWPTPPETTNLNLYNLTLSDYVLSLDFQTNNPNMPEVYLVDHYTGQNTLVSTNALTNYSFSVDANIPESIASDRFQLTYSSSLSVDNFENESFLVYPNPLKPSDLVSITSKDIDLETIKSIEINTIQGKIIRSIPSSKLNKYGNSIQLKLNSTINKGTYFLKIIAKENNYICKLIIN